MIILKEINEYYNQKILCHVENCKYQENAEKRCTLGKIVVSGENKKEDTFCDSFETK